MSHELLPSTPEAKHKIFGIGDQVSVVRTDGTVENDWKIGRIIYAENSDTIVYYAVVKPADNNTYLEKKISPQMLQTWNNTESHNKQSMYSGAELLQDRLSPSLGEIASQLDVGKASMQFDPEEANVRRSIADALEEKRLAQKRGDGDASIYWGQIAGQYTRELQDLQSKNK